MIIALDTESFGTSLRLVCGSISYRREEGKEIQTKTFFNKEELENEIIKMGKAERKKGHKTQIYSHNSGFDFFRYADIENKGYKKGKREGYNIINIGYMFMCEYLSKDGDEIFSIYDTYNLMHTNLATIGETLGYPKMELEEEVKEILYDENYKGKIPENILNKIVEYNRKDTEICLKLVEEIKGMLKKEGYSPRRIITAGQIAMSLFNKKICDYRMKYLLMEKFEPSKRNFYNYIMTNYPEEIHSAYRGAYIIANRFGEFENVTNIDVNSLYPYIMCNMKFPDLRTEFKLNNPLEDYKLEELVKTIGISKCRIEVPENKYGLLPVRYTIKKGEEEEDQNIYPNWKSTIYGIWTNLELEKAIEEGYKIKDIEWSILYNEAEEGNPLKIFMEEMYEKRNKSNINKWFYKLLMNNVHGKFAQCSNIKEYIIDDVGMTDELEERGYKKGMRLGYNYIYEKEIGKKYGKSYAPIISSYTTAGARIFMYEQMNKIEPKDLLYVANDALLFKGDYLDDFKIGENMGEFKIVRKENEELKGVNARIYGKNNYLVGKDIRLSGIKKEFINEKGLKEGKIKYERFSPITNAREISEVNAKQSLEKDLNEIKENSKEFKKKIKGEDIFLDSRTDCNSLIEREGQD